MIDFVYAPPQTPLDIVHQDASLIVVHKPAGLLSVPGRGAHLADCLIARLKDAFPQVLLVHRLDMDTSGVMVFARTPDAQRALGQQFEKRMTRKNYEALVQGAVRGKHGTVDAPLIVDWPNRPRHKVCAQTGRPARTTWQVLAPEDGNTRMKLTPITGRTHQLRVHMQALGHPILGDQLYAEDAGQGWPRLMLHAGMLGVAHPETGEEMVFRAACPF
ncbi:RluA family pseudouridine synthase [Roseicitreum antarcticum]|uniref:Pseudouridine synthase n=1 Tax=Roseicitreum antarcticum TaxID=564137 RepID=A0A1H2W7F3_9RHOB|nr:RluA family pseudouridine synthase [Roseicitreum antarcticum]SDW76471.1 ribosomal large subunit pseudouridine synthase A [Roseicitreum antarcticum]